jgi:calcineurin-like phosphoesterase family protein
LTHYYHKNIIRFVQGSPPKQLYEGLGDRPFENVPHMNEDLIRRWNEVVTPEDLVYHLGDFSFGDPKESTDVAKRLNGQKHLVWGNHDKRLRKSKEFMDQWVWCRDMAEIEVWDKKVVLCHFPMLSWNKSHHGAYHLHGHCHGTLPADPNALRVDVGVDSWDYRPVPFEEIAKVMNKRTFVPIDHHGARGNGA